MYRLFAFSALALIGISGGQTVKAQSNPVPFLTEPLVPASVAPGGPELTLTVNGTGFTSASVVNWNGVPLKTSYVSSSQLQATVPAANTAQAGTGSITVSTSNGVASNSEFFSISKVTSPAFTTYHISVPPSPATSGMQWPVAVDVNGDGKPDLVGGFVNEMVVLLGNGDGSFQTPGFFPLFGEAGSNTLNSATVTGDFNGDGKPDFAFSSASSNALAVVLGNGDGTFGAPLIINLQTGYVANFLYAADVNGDGRLDLISGNNLAQNISGSVNATFSVCLGNGDGTFQSPVEYQIGSSSYLASMAIGDVNDDGKLDLVAGVSTGPSLIFFGNGDGTFAAPFSQDIEPGDQLLLAGLHGDGNLDLLTLATGETGGINIYSGDGTGSFTSSASYGTGVNYPDPLAMVDINTDGKLDLVVPSGNEQNFGILLGNGDGTFGQPATYPAGSPSTFGIVAADFNGDGMPDLFFGSDTASTIGLGFVLLQGSFPGITSTPSSVTFSQQEISTTSAAQSVTLTNSGQAPLAISKVSIAGTNATDYAETNTCGATLPVNASCQVDITFTPTAQGTRTAALSVTDNAPGSPQAISLTGQTTPAPALTLSPSSVTFPNQYVGTSGLPITITATNPGTAPLTITSVSTSSQAFGVLNTCGSTLAAGASCAIGVFFDPGSSGSVNGTLTVADNASGSPQTIPLSGAGQDFSLSSSSSTQTVMPGSTATYTVAVNPVAGFNQTVALSCSGAPAGSTCSLSSSSIELSGSSPATVTVSVTTQGNSAAVTEPRNPHGTHMPIFFAICGWPGLLLLGRRRFGRQAVKRNAICGAALLGVICFIATGCGGNSSSTGGGTSASTYTLTVTGSFTSGSASLTHSTNLTMIVQ